MSAWHWLLSNGVVAGVIEFWVGSIPVIGIPGTIWHRISKRRHAERIAAIRSLRTSQLPPDDLEIVDRLIGNGP